MTESTLTLKTGTAETLQILRTQSLTTIVLLELEKMILSGGLQPGDRINEKALAESHSVSRGPIREAFRRLEQAGLVEIVVNRGVFVRRLNPKDAADLCDIKASLSALTGRILAVGITDEQIKTLEVMVVQMEKLAAAGDVEAYYPLNMDFHRTMLEFTGNARLIDMCAAVDKELYLFKRKSMDAGVGLDRSVAEHRVIIDALGNRDETAVSEILWQHAMTGKQRLLGSIPDSGRDDR